MNTIISNNYHYEFTSIWGNKQVLLGKKDGGLRSWNIRGIQNLMALHADVLLSFDQLYKILYIKSLKNTS